MTTAIRKRLPRNDGLQKVTGTAKYADDFYLPGMLYGKILRSPHAHARILEVNAERALALPGVRAVVFGKDTPGVAYGAIPDEYGLAIDKVRFIGDEVAAVAAVDEETAEAALAHIDVEYEVLPSVHDPARAMQEGAPVIHERNDDIYDAARNISRRIHRSYGDVEKGFGEADRIFEHTFETQVVNHAAIEPHASVAECDPVGKVTVWSSCQTPFLIRMDIARTLQMPLTRVRVIKPRVGGAFGGKREMMANDFCAAFLAVKTGRPVKVTYTREEVFSTTRQRHPALMTLKTGVTRDGRVVAKDCHIVMENGAYNGRGPDILASCPGHITILYRIPNIRFDGCLVYTNNPPGSAFRGFGNPQMRFADDSQMDIIAAEMGIDPIDLRRRNVREEGDVTPNKAIITSCGLRQCVEEVNRATDLQNRWRKLPFGHGIGIACGHHICGKKSFLPHDSSAATVKLNDDGTANVLTGASDVGQGSDMVLAMIAAEELGVPYHRIEMTTADTEVTPMDLGSFSSRVTFIAGNAVKLAAADAREQLLDAAADLLEAAREDLVIENGTVRAGSAPGRSATVEEVIRHNYLHVVGVPIVGRGAYNPPTDRLDRETGMGNASPAYSFGAQVAEVKVDLESGRVKVVRMTSAIDCGVAINPTAVEGQVEGSVSGGIGQALMEGFYTKDGLMLNPSLLEYRLPQVSDMPEMETHIVESREEEGPFGAKGVGEFVQIPTAAAIANAVYDAIGVRIYDLPITPDKVLAALGEKKGARS
ncbi:MAG: xanthine dehydrogenase family protein molybdopterin-binding subunit [Nitrospinota bacterium]|nr:xanthine dehydrogenase family protein molybdopterin-binding subunit [Nitrospinota bacterium]